jgi:hypothetical protein
MAAPSDGTMNAFLAGVKHPQRIQLLPDRQRIPWDERQPADTGLVCYAIDSRDHVCSLTADRKHVLRPTTRIAALRCGD